MDRFIASEKSYKTIFKRGRDEHIDLDSSLQDTRASHSSSQDEQRRVFYVVDLDSTRVAYHEDHVMRPLRVRLAHSLINSLGLHKRLAKVCHPRSASPEAISSFHRTAYVECLREAPRWCGHPLDPTSLAFQKEFDVPVGSSTGDCPLFPRVWELVSSQAGGSLACADAVRRGEADIAIHWGGGMHHAASAHASGFCFVNDIVLCIQQLLKTFSRVLYVDLDVHHGDGVEAAFLGNPRVMTLSLHQFGHGFFPGTGDFPSGSGELKNASAMGEEPLTGRCTPTSLFCPEGNPTFSVNVPLPSYTGDAAYVLSFCAAFDSLYHVFDPEVIVVQCGADTICGDPIGRLCVSTEAHVACVRHILEYPLNRLSNVGQNCSTKKKQSIPAILLGGGGYHVPHTAQCWALHTATAVGVKPWELPRYIPRNDPYYMDYRRQQHAMNTKPLSPSIAGGGSRPTLHVFLDPDLDHPLPMETSLIYLRHLCQSLPKQLRAIRRLREGFDRVVIPVIRRGGSALADKLESPKEISGNMIEAGAPQQKTKKQKKVVDNVERGKV